MFGINLVPEIQWLKPLRGEAVTGKLIHLHVEKYP